MVLTSKGANRNRLVPIDHADKENATHVRVRASASARPHFAPSSSFPPAAAPPRRRRPPSPEPDRRRRRHTLDELLVLPDGAPRPAAPASEPVALGALFARRLARPAERHISAGSLAAIDPSLEGTTPRALRDLLRPHGARLLAVLGAARAAPATGLPAAVDVLPPAGARAAELPTHMLAVHTRGAKGAQRPVTLFPAHDLVLAAHCAALPPLPPAPAAHRLRDLAAPAPAQTEDTAPRATISLPIVPLCIPSPPTFGLLQAYLYTRDARTLLARLLPPLPAGFAPPALPPSRDASPARAGEAAPPARSSLSAGLRAAHGARVLLQHTLAVHGLWSNVCVLGVHDDRLWRILDAAWDVLVGALDPADTRGPAPAEDARAEVEDDAEMPPLVRARHAPPPLPLA